MANGYGDYINKQFKVDKKPRVYKTTGTQYNKTEVQERAAIRSQLANDVAYWQQKRGVTDDREKNHVAIAENYYKQQEKRDAVEKAGQKRMSANKGKGKYSAEDRLQEAKEYRDKDRKTSAKEYQKNIGEFATSDFIKKYNNYSSKKGITESDVRFESYMDKQKGKKNTVAQQLAPEFAPKKKKEKSFLDKIFDVGHTDKDKKKSASLNLSIRDGGTPTGKSKGKNEKGKGNILKDFVNVSAGAMKSVNPFDDETFGDSLMKNAMKFDKKKSTQFDEFSRGAGRTTNTASLGLMGNLDKNMHDGKTPEYLSKRKFGEGGGADVFSDLLGYAVPGAALARGLKGTKLGADTALKALSKGGALTRAKEGAIIGAAMAGVEIGGNETLNPDDHTWKENLARLGIETAGGAVLDPLLSAGGALIGAGGKKLLNKLKQPPKNKLKLDDIDSSEVPFTVDEPTQVRQPIATQVVSKEYEIARSVLQNNPHLNDSNVQFILDDYDISISKGELDEIRNEIRTSERPGLDGPKSTAVDQTAATSTRPRYDIDTLMKSYKGQDVSDVAVKKYDPSKLAKQVDDMPKKATDSVLDTPVKEVDFTKGIDVAKLKDISGFKGATNDVYRIFDKVFGKDADVSKRILGELDASKARYVNMQEDLLKELDEKIVKGLGIKKGSKLSKYVQDFGEGNMDLPTLMEKAPNDWEKVVDADRWFRAKYDSLIDEVNASRKLVYPNSPDKQIPKRKDYYRHFTEFTGLTGLKNIFDTPGAINPHLAGTSEFTKPKSKWAGFMQQRGMGPYKSDAVGGFLNYAPSASYAKEIDPNIMNFRGLKNELADLTEKSPNVNNFIEFLNDYSNDLAGKTNPVLDRFVQKYIPGGRQSMAALTWVNSRVKTNTILGNLGSTLAQLANVPLGVAFAKQHTAKGLGRTLKGIVDNAEPIHKSAFMKERYSQSLYRKFDQKLLDQPQKMAEWLIETSDRAGSSFVWNSVYEKGLKQGVSNPIKYADENTRRLIAGRGVGEVPLAQKSKVVQMVVPFTLEVGNLWRVMNDMGKAKDFGGLAILFASNFALNKVMEEVRGSPVTFDPIDAMMDATEPGLTPLERGGRVGGEMLSNMPAGQFLAGAYPEYGEIGGFKGPTREKLFGERNPQRFGTGLVAANGLSDPLFKLLPPFGGNQLKKTLEGLEVMKDKGSYKEGKGILSGLPFMGEQNELNFPVENSKKDKLQMSLFGPYASDNAREYFDNKRRPLGEKQTTTYKQAEASGRGQEFYDSLMVSRRDATVKRKIKEIYEDKTLTDKERRKSIETVLKLAESK